jgi:hypothetical protein
MDDTGEPIRRGRGRPRGSRVREPRSSVSTWLPARHHDRLIRMANRRGASVSATVRDVLILTLRGGFTPQGD